MSTASSVQVGVAGPTVWVRVAGRGTFQNSTGLREFSAEMAERGHHDFVVDLRDCEMMDSTFLGTLAGIALRAGKEGRLRIVRANPRCRQVMKNLGIDRIVQLEEDATVTDPPPLHDAEDNPPREAKRETIIEAHQNLVEANPENKVRFEDVLDFLKHKEPRADASQPHP